MLRNIHDAEFRCKITGDRSDILNKYADKATTSRSETRANGAGNIPEYGTFTKEDEFRGLAAMSPYANVKPGAAYPAVLFEHGVNDIRVDVWMTLKTGSRLAAATSSGKPVLMRLEYDAGHGPGATRDQAQRRTADRWAFMLWQAGAEGFQPAP